MGLEIERKFLVKNDGYKLRSATADIIQGFINLDPDRVVRIRISKGIGKLTIKGVSEGATRLEYEYSIPLKEAEMLLKDICIKPLITKIRYTLEIEGLIWEVDEFLDENEGLRIAEIELPEENVQLDLPEWVGEEVTGKKKYYNVNLIRNPYKNW